MIKWLYILLSVAALSAAGADSKAEKEVLAAMDAWKQATMKKDRVVSPELGPEGKVWF